jgi:hypothetical protein
MSATVAASYAQEVEAIEAILSKANLLLREFEDREKNAQRHVSVTPPLSNLIHMLFSELMKFIECQHAIIHSHIGRHEKQVDYDDSIVSLMNS